MSKQVYATCWSRGVLMSELNSAMEEAVKNLIELQETECVEMEAQVVTLRKERDAALARVEEGGRRTGSQWALSLITLNSDSKSGSTGGAAKVRENLL